MHKGCTIYGIYCAREDSECPEDNFKAEAAFSDRLGPSDGSAMRTILRAGIDSGGPNRWGRSTGNEKLGFYSTRRTGNHDAFVGQFEFQLSVAVITWAHGGRGVFLSHIFEVC